MQCLCGGVLQPSTDATSLHNSGCIDLARIERSCVLMRRGRDAAEADAIAVTNLGEALAQYLDRHQ